MPRTRRPSPEDPRRKVLTERVEVAAYIVRTVALTVAMSVGLLAGTVWLIIQVVSVAPANMPLDEFLRAVRP